MTIFIRLSFILFHTFFSLMLFLKFFFFVLVFVFLHQLFVYLPLAPLLSCNRTFIFLSSVFLFLFFSSFFSSSFKCPFYRLWKYYWRWVMFPARLLIIYLPLAYLLACDQTLWQSHRWQRHVFLKHTHETLTSVIASKYSCSFFFCFLSLFLSLILPSSLFFSFSCILFLQVF